MGLSWSDLGNARDTWMMEPPPGCLIERRTEIGAKKEISSTSLSLPQPKAEFASRFRDLIRDLNLAASGEDSESKFRIFVQRSARHEIEEISPDDPSTIRGWRVKMDSAHAALDGDYDSLEDIVYRLEDLRSREWLRSILKGSISDLELNLSYRYYRRYLPSEIFKEAGPRGAYIFCCPECRSWGATPPVDSEKKGYESNQIHLLVYHDAVVPFNILHQSKEGDGSQEPPDQMKCRACQKKWSRPDSPLWKRCFLFPHDHSIAFESSEIRMTRMTFLDSQAKGTLEPIFADPQ